MTIEEQVFAIHMKDYWTEEDRQFLNAHRDVSIYPERDAKAVEELNRKAEEKYLAQLKRQEEGRKRLEAHRARMRAEGLA